MFGPDYAAACADQPLMRDDVTELDGKRLRVLGVDPAQDPPLATCVEF